MSNFTNPKIIARSFAWVIAGVWAYCLIVAPLFSEESYGTVALEKSKDIGIGFTIAALVVGGIWLLIAQHMSKKPKG